MIKKPQKQTILRLCFIFLMAFLIIGLFSFNSNVFADVGNNNRYDNGGESSSGDSGDLFIIWWLLFDVLGPIPAMIIIIIGVIVVAYLKKTGKLKTITKTANQVNTSSSYSYLDEASIVSKIQAVDPNFSKDAFIGWVREVFMKIQTAWTKRDWKQIRPFESNELFNQHNQQLDEYISNNKINVVEKIKISSVSLRDFRQDGDKEVLEVELHAIMRDYVIDAKTKKVLESNPNQDWNMEYIMTFQRKTGVKTKAGTSNKSTTNCPNCGAPTEITSAGQCEYCDSVITTGEHDWVLSNIQSK